MALPAKGWHHELEGQGSRLPEGKRRCRVVIEWYDSRRSSSTTNTMHHHPPNNTATLYLLVNSDLYDTFVPKPFFIALIYTVWPSNPNKKKQRNQKHPFLRNIQRKKTVYKYADPIKYFFSDSQTQIWHTTTKKHKKQAFPELTFARIYYYTYRYIDL